MISPVRNFKSAYAEPFVFLLVTVWNMLPLFSGRFFPTLDGPAHLYNSNLIASLLTDHHSALNNFLTLVKDPLPNWTGHAVLAALNYFLPAFAAEKILLALYIIALPWAFRSLLKTISPGNYFLSYFIFPFTYSFVLYLGFYNFCIALVFLFVTLNYWILNREKIYSYRKILPLVCLMTLTYFSHVFVFATLLMIMLISILSETALSAAFGKGEKRILFSTALKDFLALLCSALLPIILFLLYFKSPGQQAESFLSFTALKEDLKNTRSLIAFNLEEEQKFTKKIFYVIMLLLAIGVFLKLNAVRWKREETAKANLSAALKNILSPADSWFLVMGVILFFYFRLPDSDGSAGFFSVRLNLLFFLLSIVWLSARQLPRWLTILSALTVLTLNYKLNNYRVEETKKLNAIAVECNTAADYITPGSTILPITLHDNWLLGHFSNYLGADKPVVILENYEAETNFFPVRWKKQLKSHQSNTSIFPCTSWGDKKWPLSAKIDYVFILGNKINMQDSCPQAITTELSEKYTLRYHTDFCRLYEMNK